MLTVSQKSDKEFNLTFDSNVKDAISANDFQVYTKVNNAEIKSAINKVTVDAEDSKKAVLSTWQSLTADAEYYVQFRDSEPIVIKAAQLRKQDAVKVDVKTTSAIVNELTDIKYVIVDANGIEVPQGDATVTFTTEDAGCSISGNQIVFFEKGRAANVKVEYSAWYINDNNEYVQKTFTSTAVIVSKEADPVTLKDVKWTVDNANNTAVFDAAGYAQQSFIAANDVSYLNLLIKLSNDTEIKSDTALNLTYSSADSSVLVMNGNQIRPVKAGATQILVYKDNAATPFTVIPIEVKPNRIPTTLSATLNKTTLNTNTETIADKVTVTVTVKDNYGKPFEGAVVSSDKVSGVAMNAISGTPITNADGKASFDFVAGTQIAANAEGALAFKVTATANDKSTNSAVLSFTCKKITSAATTQKLVLGATVNDTKITSGSSLNDYKVTVQTAGYSNGYQIAAPVDAIADPGHDYAAGTNYYYELSKGAAKITNKTGYSENVATGAINTVAINSADNTASKLSAGEYTIRLYKVVANAAGVATEKSLVDSATLTIKDTQPAITVSKIQNTVADFSDVSAAFEVKYDNETVTNVTFGTIVGTSSVYVKDVAYEVSFGTMKYVVTKEVGKTLTK